MSIHELKIYHNFKNRLLGIDYGERFIGIAISDLSWSVAKPLSHIDQRRCKDIKTAIKNLISDESIVAIVLGYPINMNGSIGFSAQKVEKFKENILPKIPIVFWDERLSTALAERAMIEADISRYKRKQKIDSLAANNILQNALDCLGIKLA